MLINQTLLYSVSNNTNNIRFKLCKSSFNAVWKKRLKGIHSSLPDPTRASGTRIYPHTPTIESKSKFFKKL